MTGVPKDSNGTESSTPREGSKGNDGFVTSVLSVDGDSLDRLFAVLMFLFFGVLLASTPRYSADSRLFPLVIGVPSFVLFGVLLLIQTSDRVADLVGGIGSSDVFRIDERFSDDATETADGADTRFARRKRLVVISLWMGLLFALVLVVGFIPATVLFLLGFYRLYADLGWIRSIAYTVVFTAAIVFVFEFVMGVSLHEGAFGIELPF